jgi:glycosyltransferase involved in cell wall biosynthesis
VKALFLNNRLFPSGGAERCMWDTARQLRSREWEVVLVGRGPKYTEAAAEGLRQLELDSVANNDVEALRIILKSEKPDIIHAHAVTNTAVLSAARQAAPTVHTVHDATGLCLNSVRFLHRRGSICKKLVGVGCFVNAITEHCTPRRPDRLLRNWYLTQARLRCLRRMPLLIAPSEYIRSLLLAHGYPPGQVRTIANFVRAECMLDPVLPPSGTILFAGFVHWIKGVDLLLEALRGVSGEWRLVVAGAGTGLERMQALARQYDLTDRVQLLGYVEESKMQVTYDSCSFLVMPSRWPEAFGMCGLEAMSRGRAVVAFDVGGIHDWLIDGETGVLVRPGDIGGLRSAIQTLLGDLPRAERLGAAGRQRVRSSFNAETQVNLLIEAYKDVIRTREVLAS